MDIRLAVAADIAHIRGIAGRAYINYVPRIGRVPAPMVADFQGHVQRGETSVATSGGGVIGYLIAYARVDDYFVENVAVDPASAGVGVGRTLMGHAEMLAREVGKSVVRLYTNVRMWENFSFYAGLGYHKTGEATESGFHRIYFEKNLERT